MKKVLCIIYPNFSLYEITTLTSTLALSFDITIDYVASEHSMMVSEDGLPCQPTKTLDQIRIEDYSCVILPGMINIGPALQDEKLISFLRSLDEQDRNIITALGFAHQEFARKVILSLRLVENTDNYFKEQNEYAEEDLIFTLSDEEFDQVKQSIENSL